MSNYKVVYQIEIDYKDALHNSTDPPFNNYTVPDWEKMFDEQILNVMDEYEGEHGTTITIIRNGKKLF